MWFVLWLIKGFGKVFCIESEIYIQAVYVFPVLSFKIILLSGEHVKCVT